MSEVDTEGITTETDGTTAYVTFDRPDIHNALTPEMMAAGARAIRRADADDEIRAIIVTGAGEEAFSAGADLDQTIPESTGDNAGSRRIEDDDLFLRFDLVTTPIISAINGICVAGGMEFIQATDIRIAGEHATFGLQEPRWGIAPAGGSHVRLPRQIPYCRAMEFLLTGDLFDAEHALSAGLINEIVPRGEALARAEEVADSIAENSPHAVGKIKEMAVRGLRRDIEDAFRLESIISEDVFDHEDAVEGPRAFVEDRDPSFRV